MEVLRHYCYVHFSHSLSCHRTKNDSFGVNTDRENDVAIDGDGSDESVLVVYSLIYVKAVLEKLYR